MIGNGKLLGELLGRALVPSMVLFACINELFELCTEGTLETAAGLLTAAGPHLDNPTFRRKEEFENVFLRIKSIIASAPIGPRPRCLLQDVLDLRAKGWVKAVPAPAPMPVRQQVSMQSRIGPTTISLAQGLTDSTRPGPAQATTWRSAPQQGFVDSRRGYATQAASLRRAGTSQGFPQQGGVIESYWRDPAPAPAGGASPGLSIVNILKSLPMTQDTPMPQKGKR